jgi:hypothetical protein
MTVALAPAIALLACSGSSSGGGGSNGGASNPGSAAISGLPFQTQTALFAVNGSLTEIYFWNASDLCGFEASSASDQYPFPSSSSGLQIQVDHAVTGPETITIGQGANANTFVISPTCQEMSGPAVQTGTVTITSVSGATMQGSLDVTADQGNGVTNAVTGTFAAANCNALFASLPMAGSCD